jgi:SAM-dependent methyltransferase
MAITIADALYLLEAHSVSTVHRWLRAHPSSAPYLSGDTFRAMADHVLDMDGSIDPRRVIRGDIVFVETERLPGFIASVLPRVTERFVLITHSGDDPVDESSVGLADDGRIARWFAQNVLCRHSKVTPIPIGLESRWRHNNGVLDDFRLLARRPVAKRPRILYGFNVITNPEERGLALESLRRARAADEYMRTNARAYRKKLSEYCFVASPPGHGVDCHRTWEALYLGVVPIVKRSPLYDGFPGLPILVVDDWRELEELGEDRLSELYNRLHVAPEGIEQVWERYWASAVRAARREARESIVGAPVGRASNSQRRPDHVNWRKVPLVSSEIEQIYREHVLPKKNRAYLDKYERLPVHLNDRKWRWEGKDLPRVFALLEFREFVQTKNLRFRNVLSLNGSSDPEYEYLSCDQITNYDYEQDPARYDLHSLDLGRKDFDFFMANQTLEHLYDPALALRNVHAHLVTGGMFYANAPAINIPHSTPFHYYTGFTPVGLGCLVRQAGFRILDIGFWGNIHYAEFILNKRCWPDYRLLRKYGSQFGREAIVWIFAVKE